MDRINQYLEKVYLVGFENQDTLTFNQGVAGSNPAGLTTSKVRIIRKTKQTPYVLVHYNHRESELK